MPSSLFASTSLGAALHDHGVHRRDIDRTVVWWMMSKPGETIMLVRYGAPHLKIDHDGNVTEVAPPSRGTAAAACLASRERRAS